MSYIPVSCEFHDHMENFAMYRKPVLVQYLDDNQVAKTIEALITDVFARDGADYLTLSTGVLIRLDHIIEVNGIRLDSFPPTCAIN